MRRPMLASLRPFDIHAGRIALAIAQRYPTCASVATICALDRRSTSARTPRPQPRQVEQWIDYELSRPVIRDLAAAVDVHDGYRRPAQARARALPFMPCVKTGGCSRNQISSASIVLDAVSVRACMARHVGSYSTGPSFGRASAGHRGGSATSLREAARTESRVVAREGLLGAIARADQRSRRRTRRSRARAPDRDTPRIRRASRSAPPADD
jgi:hypothetical protein